jgi:hypothetical protein
MNGACKNVTEKWEYVFVKSHKEDKDFGETRGDRVKLKVILFELYEIID